MVFHSKTWSGSVVKEKHDSRVYVNHVKKFKIMEEGRGGGTVLKIVYVY